MKVAPLKQRETSSQSLDDVRRCRGFGKNAAPSHITRVSRKHFRKKMVANNRPNPIGTDDNICLKGYSARKFHRWPSTRCAYAHTLGILVVKLFWECFAKLMKHCFPRRERRRVGKPLNHFAFTVEKLALNA